MTYVKLDTGILLSSIWSEPSDVRVVWITLLAMADQNGMVAASATGVAKMAGLPLGVVTEALELFQSPDPNSRTPDDDGRRLARVDGGYVLLNHAKYREAQDKDARREQVREAVRRHREKSCNQPVISGNQSNPLRSDQINSTQTQRQTDGSAAQAAVVALTQQAGRQAGERKAPANPLVDRRAFEAEFLALVRELARVTDRDPVEVAREASSYEGARTSPLNPASMTDDRLANSVLDLRANLQAAKAKAERQARGIREAR